MKKVLYSIFVVCLIFLTSCAKDEPGGTAVEQMAGQWVVELDCIDDDGNSLGDMFGVGQFLILTYNTPDNSPSKLYVDDQGNFWTFKVVANCDLASLSFNADAISEAYDGEDLYDINVKISDGKITKGGIVTPGGHTADKIEFDILFEDDGYTTQHGGAYYHHMHLSGWRYTGFVDDGF